MSLHHPLLVVLLCWGLAVHSQTIPDGFIHQVTLCHADLGAPTSVLMSANKDYLILSYQKNPTKIMVYETNNWNLVNKFEVPGKLSLKKARLDCQQPNKLYVDYGLNHPKFYCFNLLANYPKRVLLKQSPDFSCGYTFQVIDRLRKQSFPIGDDYLLLVNHPKREIQVFAKNLRRT